MFCNNCGKEIKEETQFCPYCGASLATKEVVNDYPAVKGKSVCLPSFILGLIGSLFGIFGGICTTMCSVFSSNSAFIWIVGGSLVGLVGACLCLSKSKLGSVLELIGALMIIVRAYGGGADFMTVIALIFLLFGGLIGVVYSFIIKKK